FKLNKIQKICAAEQQKFDSFIKKSARISRCFIQKPCILSQKYKYKVLNYTIFSVFQQALSNILNLLYSLSGSYINDNE
ncbi:MAG: hypothetical protein L3J56_12645, partial [Bacteroidales bacterium]|nr:hypothetical protein [Bacteroidales bacterium]